MAYFCEISRDIRERAWAEIARVVGDGHVEFIPNSGNAGDALIAAATFQFFERHGVKYTVREMGHIPSGAATILLSGGGWLYRHYRSYWVDYFKALQGRDDLRVIILPCSMYEIDEEAPLIDERFTVFFRDAQSFRYAQTHTRANVMLSHDMALGLDYDALKRDCDEALSAEAMRHPRWAEQGERWRAAVGAAGPDVAGVLTIMRADWESCIRSDDRDNDVPINFNTVWDSRALAYRVSLDLLSLVGGARIVFTNRLHSGVAGLIAGSRVRYLDNNYGKIFGVCAHSLSKLDEVEVLGMAFFKGRCWVPEAELNERKARIEALDTAKAWLVSEHEAWMRKAMENEASLGALRAYIAELESAKAWLVTQHEAWQAKALDAEAALSELRQRTTGLTQPKSWLRSWADSLKKKR